MLFGYNREFFRSFTGKFASDNLIFPVLRVLLRAGNQGSLIVSTPRLEPECQISPARVWLV